MFSKLFFCLIFLTALTPLYSQEPLAQQLKSIIENKKAKDFLDNTLSVEPPSESPYYTTVKSW